MTFNSHKVVIWYGMMKDGTDYNIYTTILFNPNYTIKDFIGYVKNGEKSFEPYMVFFTGDMSKLSLLGRCDTASVRPHCGVKEPIISDRICVLDGGEIVVCGTPSEVADQDEMMKKHWEPVSGQMAMVICSINIHCMQELKLIAKTIDCPRPIFSVQGEWG